MHVTIGSGLSLDPNKVRSLSFENDRLYIVMFNDCEIIVGGDFFYLKKLAHLIEANVTRFESSIDRSLPQGLNCE